jgi:predicted nucleotidyltransferase component of viral defense system
MDFDEVRRFMITALFSDDALYEKLVLKGGNALRLIYNLGSRSSLDIDVSIEEDFVDLDDTRRRLFRALETRFELAGFCVFDPHFTPRPSTSVEGDRWGGYELTFKLIELEKRARLKGNLEQIRREAFVIGPSEKRIFTVDMSKHEHCVGKREVELDGFSVFVYTPAMIAIEKLRAICQQMEAYPRKKYRNRRARDFYDIHLIAEEGTDLTLPENRTLLSLVFRAKEVPIELLWKVQEERDFHLVDWPRVQASVS